MAERGCSGNQDAWRSRPSDDGTTGQPRVKSSRTSRGRAANTASGPGHSALWSSKVWVGASPWKPRALVIFSYLPGVAGLGVALRSGVGRIVCCWLHCSSVTPDASALLPLTPPPGCTFTAAHGSSLVCARGNPRPAWLPPLAVGRGLGARRAIVRFPDSRELAGGSVGSKS